MQKLGAFGARNTNSTLADLGLQILDQAHVARRMAAVQLSGALRQRQQTDRTFLRLVVQVQYLDRMVERRVDFGVLTFLDQLAGFGVRRWVLEGRERSLERLALIRNPNRIPKNPEGSSWRV